MNRNPKRTTAAGIEAMAAQWVARRDAGLAPGEERELQRWIETDPRHHSALAFFDDTWATLAKPAAGGAGALLERRLQELAMRRHRRRATAGVAAALMLLAGALAWSPFGRTEKPGASSALVLVPSAQTLPDGSVVELTEGSRIAVDYTASIRRVTLLAGEAHFEVRKDSVRPFVVSAEGVDVRAVGTAFSVKRGVSVVEVLVTHGSVAVEESAAAASSVAPRPLAALAAGELAVVPIAASVAAPEVRAVAPAELNQRLAWRSPRLEFTRTPLSEAVSLINHHAPSEMPRLSVADAEVGALRISGIFRADNIEAFVLLLEGAFEVRVERTAGTISLHRAR